MSFQVRTETRPASGNLDGTIYLLEQQDGSARAAIWPALGFNCFVWQMSHHGKPLDLLYSDPQLFHDGRPTRSGIPILFPFPNRIRDGRFTWDGKSYALPLNDSTGKNAIHGFVCRLPWNVIGKGANDHEAWLVGEFRAAVEAPQTLSMWPASYQIRVTTRLTATTLRLEARIENPDRHPLPFGLGYHPYFKLPLSVGGAAEACTAEVKARSYWVLQDSLPTGGRNPVDVPRDLNLPRKASELQLDDILTQLPDTIVPGAGALCLRGTLGENGLRLRLLSSLAFREMVLFTPPHRQAICLEPYTCVTDAVNLEQQGVDTGLLVLQPGEVWEGIFEMTVS